MTQYTNAPEYVEHYQYQPVQYLRSPRLLGRTLIGALLAVAALELVSRLLSFHAFELLRDAAASGHVDDRGDPDDHAATGEFAFAALVALLVRLPIGILFVSWLYRASTNLGRHGRTWQPGWAIGAWFVPIAGLVMPLLAVAEVDRLSDERAAAIDGRPPARARWVVLALWWVAFLLYEIAYPAIIAAGVGSDMAKAPMDGTHATLVVIAVNVVTWLVSAGAAIMAALLVRRINANQERLLAAYPAYVR